MRAPEDLTLGSHIRLHSLAILSSSIVDVLTSSVRADEGNSFDQGFVADEVDCIDAAVNYVQNTLR